MNLANTLRGIVAFVALVLLHFSLRPLLGWRADIDFLVIAVILSAVRLRYGVAALLGCVVGLAADSLTPATFGAGAIAMTAVAFAAAWLKAVFYADSLLVNALFLFAGKYLFDLLRIAAERRSGGGELIYELFMWAPLSGAATAIAGILLLVVFRPLLERSS